MSKLLDKIFEKVYESENLQECDDCAEDTAPKTEFDIAKELYTRGVKGESTTIEDYYGLKEMLTDQEDIAIIDEIISDEKNHIELFNKLIQKYDHIEPAQDGLESKEEIVEEETFSDYEETRKAFHNGDLEKAKELVGDLDLKTAMENLKKTPDKEFQDFINQALNS